MSGLVGRVNFTFHEGTTQALIKVDGVTIHDHVAQDKVMCPDLIDMGKSCLDLTMPYASDSTHIYNVELVESGGAESYVTSIQMPAGAAAGSRWFPMTTPYLGGVIMAGVAIYAVRKHRWFNRNKKRRTQ